ncbi:MAG: DNA internalization-related competence protein ComEC/Rec2 [Candidatus Schekmanbacteria bacterium]|nr:DNA internalization-related competence protein ComEC/Rec2 [Candidatus Schekmanbacteria bacterium]
MKKRPLVSIFLAYAAGLLLGRFLSLPAATYLIAALILLSAGGVIYYILRKPLIIPVGILLVLIPLGGWRQKINAPPSGMPLLQQLADNNRYKIKGRIISFPQQYNSRKQFKLDVKEIISQEGKVYPVAGQIQVNVYNKQFVPEYGADLEIITRLRPVPAYRNPGGFNYRDFMSRRNIYGSATIYKPDQIIHVEKGNGNIILSWVYGLKTRLSRFLRENTQQPYQGILRTILLGEKSSFSPRIQEQFRQTGTAHILSISGLHLSFVALLIFRILRMSVLWGLPPRHLLQLGKYYKPSQLAAFFSLPFLIFYTLLVESPVATVRALIMVSVYLLGIIIERDRDLFNSLAFAALVILIWQPGAWIEVDFQLSFVTVFFLFAAIYLPQPPLPIPAWLFQGLTVPIIASLAVSPLTAYHFQQISLIGFIANIIIVPLSSLLIPIGLVAAFASLLAVTLGQILVAPALWLLQLILYLTQFFSQIPLAAINLSPPTIPQVVSIYALLFALLQLPHTRLAYYAILPLIFITGMVFRPQAASIHPGLEITVLDVGQGDSTFIKFPNGENMLIDGGGVPNDRFDIGAQVVAPVLRYKQVKRIDTMILTHPRSEHLNGLKAIIRQFPVGRILEALPFQDADCKEYDSRSYRQFKELATQKRVAQQYIYGGQELTIDQAQIIFLHPPQEGFKGGISDQSLVFKLRYKRFSLLFTGDLTRRGQKYLAKTRPQDLSAMILKAPYHGAAQAFYPPFSDLVNPKAVIFTAAFHNRYRHPNRKHLDYYHQTGAQIYRTDYHGAILINTNGHDYRISIAADAS